MMIPANERNLGEALVSAKLMSTSELDRAIENVEKKKSPSLIIQLIENDFLKFNVFQKFLMQNYKIRTAILNAEEIPQNVIGKIGFDLMKEKMIIPVMVKDVGGSNKMALGMVNPLDEKTILEVQKKSNHDVTPVLISLSDFKETYDALQSFEQKQELTPVMSYEEQLKMKDDLEKPAKKVEALAFEMIQVKPETSENTEYLGKSIKKFREEIALKLSLDEKDYASLKQENYSRSELLDALRGLKKSTLEKNFENLDLKLKIEALANSLINRGILTKNDILVAGSVSKVFGEEAN